MNKFPYQCKVFLSLFLQKMSLVFIVQSKLTITNMHLKTIEIFLLDSHDYSFIRALDVDSCFNFKSASPMTVKMALSPDHLVAHVFTNTSKLIQLVRIYFFIHCCEETRPVTNF